MQHTILSIEDQNDIRRLIRLTLEYKGHRVIEASAGAQGLEMARSQRPDLILLDVMMPGIDGLRVSQTLAADASLSAIPVIMISALGGADDVDAGLQTGVRAYLVKPFSPRELLGLVRQLLDEPRAATC
jgi:DNA-binding response OmpR family regulator